MSLELYLGLHFLCSASGAVLSPAFFQSAVFHKVNLPETLEPSLTLKSYAFLLCILNRSQTEMMHITLIASLFRTSFNVSR